MFVYKETESVSDSLLQQFGRLVQMLGGQFGESCQIILYKMNRESEKEAGSVLAVSGTMTTVNRGDPLPEFLTLYIAQNGMRDGYGFINKAYPGLVLRSSVLFITEKNNKVTGCLCIHHNIVHMQMLISFLEEFTRSGKLEDENVIGEQKRSGGKTYAASDIQGFMDSIISEFIVERLGQHSFSTMEKNDKIALIADLDSKGFFLVKGAVNMIAKRMNVSKFSVYNYLDEIRTK
jgi:predicted transcriptional regulator YheO